MQRFSADLRIRTSAQYQQVFKRRRRLFSPLFTLYYFSNKLEHPRLGVVVSKRNVRFAVKRNLVKRITREHFRTRQDNFQDVDIVLVARQEANKASREEIHQCLEKLFTQLLERRSKRSSG